MSITYLITRWFHRFGAHCIHNLTDVVIQTCSCRPAASPSSHSENKDLACFLILVLKESGSKSAGRLAQLSAEPWSQEVGYFYEYAFDVPTLILRWCVHPYEFDVVIHAPCELWMGSLRNLQIKAIELLGLMCWIESTCVEKLRTNVENGIPNGFAQYHDDEEC